MPTLGDLPDEVLELILQHVMTAAPPLQSDGNSEHRDDTFHRVADWYTLASVDRRWRSIMQAHPVRLCLVFHRYDDDLLSRLNQLACSKAPVVSLKVLEPRANKFDRTYGSFEFDSYPVGAVGHMLTQLLGSSNFQRVSGPTLQHVAFEGQGYFEFTAPQEAYPALRSLQGVGHYLPTSLPPLLENLECTAKPVLWSTWGSTPCKFAADSMEAAAIAVCGLGHLKWLTVRQCFLDPLPLSFVSQLPLSVQAATFESCLLSTIAGDEQLTRSRWQSLVPQHLHMTEWTCKEDAFIRGGTCASFTLEAKQAGLF